MLLNPALRNLQGFLVCDRLNLERTVTQAGQVTFQGFGDGDSEGGAMNAGA